MEDREASKELAARNAARQVYITVEMRSYTSLQRRRILVRPFWLTFEDPNKYRKGVAIHTNREWMLECLDVKKDVVIWVPMKDISKWEDAP